MAERDYLTIADVLGLHGTLIRRHGGASGVRGHVALETALFRPQTGYYKDIVAEAPALPESLAIYHPFVDENASRSLQRMFSCASMAGGCSSRQCRSAPR